jgi:hypothetical protein
MGIPQEQAVQIIQGVMSQEQGMPEQGMDPSMMQGQGMTPDMMPAMDPGMAMMQMGGASSDDSLIEEILNALNQGANPEEVIGFLVEQGMPEQEAMQTVMQLVQSSNSQTQPTMYKGGELPKAQVGYTFPTTFKTFGEPVRVAETDQLTGVETVQSSRPGSGFGAQVQDINKFMNTHAWYFGKLSEEEKTKFINEVKSGKESTLVKNFQKAYNNLLTDEAKKRKLPDAEITKIIEEIGFSDKGPRKLDGKFGAFTSSRPYFNFNVIEDKVDDKDDPKNKLKDKLKANAVDRGDINVPDIQGVRAPDVAEWTATDINNFIGAVRDKQSIKSYFPYADRFSPEFMDPTMYDPSRELAAQAEQANILTQGMGQFVGPQALSARASQVQGQGAKGAADILSKYNNLNVGLANQFDAQNVQLANQAQQYNQAKAQELYDKGVITQQQRDNANRQADAVIRQGFAQGWKNASDIAMLNANQEQYKVNPYTGTVFHTGVQRPFDPVKQQADYYKLLQQNMEILNDPGAAVSATNAQLRSSSGTPAYAKGGYVLGANVFPPMFY